MQKENEMKIQVGKHEVGDGCKPFIIAEVGSNWRTFDDCKHSISMAKACGADAVKFQLFDWESMYGFDEGIADGLFPENTTCLNSLPLDWLPKLKEKADACGIEFMCSAFSPELIKAVDPYVNVHKVASAELTHVRMLETLHETRKPVILSTGASGIQDIKNALLPLRWNTADVTGVQKGCDVILMYCVAAYPAQEITLETIKALKDQFNTLVGYSDHSLDVLHLPVDAVRTHGACVLEKHFTAIDADTPDRLHSLTIDQFKHMVKSIREARTPRIGTSGEEHAMVARHNRRIIAIRDIALGELLKEGDNFGIYRSLKDDTHAFSPWIIDQVSGKISLNAIKAGDGIGPGDV